MLKANIEAQIECKRNERKKIIDELFDIAKTVSKIKRREKELLEKESDLYYEIKELEDMINE